MENGTTAQPGATENTIVVEDAKVTAPTKVTFGFSSISHPTPESAKNIFEFYFYFSKAIVGWIAASHLLTTAAQYEITIFITLLLDVIVRGLTKMFGVTVDTDIK